MTDLTRVVRRKVVDARGTALVVALAPEGIWLRLPRKRIAYLMPYRSAFKIAAERYGMAEKAAKKAARKARRAA